MDRSTGEGRLSDMFRDPVAEFKDEPAVTGYLQALKEYSLSNLNLFVGDGSQSSLAIPQPGPQLPAMPQRNPLLPFQLNVLVDNSGTQAAPIVIESNPTWSNLFGRIERLAYMGTYLSDHMMLKPGSIHQANGGYLVLNARDLLMNAGVWEGLSGPSVTRSRAWRTLQCSPA